MHYDRLITTGELGGPKSVFVENGSACAVDGCEEIAVAVGLCNMHYKRRARKGAVGERGRLRARVGTGVDAKGYRVLYVKGRQHKEHRLVMAKKIGRPLRSNENVHHKDGDKLNNDPSNLELWVKTQPCGQRATDRVKSALALLKDYPDLAALEGYRLVALESQAATDLLLDVDFNSTAGMTAGLI